MRVLIIDDDELARETMRQFLERSDCEVVAVENAIAGLAEVHQAAFDAIVCDYSLPFMGGQNFYEEIRIENPEAARRFIFVTGYASDQEISSQLEATGQPVIGKPFGFDDLVQAVRSVGGTAEPS